MTDNDIIKALDGADVFLRNRANSEPAQLNEYDIEAFIDIANVCDEAANLINRQKAEIERLNKQLEEFKFLESRVNSIKNTPKDTFSGALISIAEGVARYEAIKEFAERLKEYVESYDVTTGYRVTIVQAVEEETIDNLVKEMVGEG